MRSLDSLAPRYSTILCDLWGVVHDGHRLFDGVSARLARWTAEGRRVILITNAPRTAETVRGQLDALGLPKAVYHGISTGGQAGIDALLERPPSAFLGTCSDRTEMERAGLRFVDEGFADLCCIGLDDRRAEVADYVAQFKPLIDRNVLFHCLNPDRVVIHGGRREQCAGALADAYGAMGGQVAWYGKPYPAIYRHALGLVGNPARDSVLAVGDGLQTDVLGAAREGLDCLYVTGGIGGGAGFPADFAERQGLGDWAPVGVVPTIA